MPKPIVFEENDAPILIVLGQSNAHGHGTRLSQEEKIIVPLKNVKGLDREKNQAFGLEDVQWSGFVTGGMNLGEIQDHTYCLAEGFARLWESTPDLPTLYIVQISIGGQGIACVERDNMNMWYPKREPVIKCSPFGEIDVSLYPLAVETLGNVTKNLRKAGKQPRIIGLHWNQWESEVYTGGEALKHAKVNLLHLFEGFKEALGVKSVPVWLYEPLSLVYDDPEGLKYMHDLFEEMASEDECMYIMKTSKYPGFNPDAMDRGIFLSDCVHYRPEVQRWFADMQYDFSLGQLN